MRRKKGEKRLSTPPPKLTDAPDGTPSPAFPALPHHPPTDDPLRLRYRTPAIYPTPAADLGPEQPHSYPGHDEAVRIYAAKGHKVMPDQPHVSSVCTRTTTINTPESCQAKPERPEAPPAQRRTIRIDVAESPRATLPNHILPPSLKAQVVNGGKDFCTVQKFPDRNASDSLWSSFTAPAERWFSRRLSSKTISVTNLSDFEREFHVGRRDDLTSLVGAHGPYQRATFQFGLLVAFVLPLQAMLPQTLTPEVDYWCARPSQNVSVEEWKEAAIPKTPSGQYSKCEMFLLFPNGSWSTVRCTRWEFDDANYGTNIIKEFELVCERSWLVPFSSSSFLVGGLCSLIVSGPASDRFGRKPVIQISVVTALVSAAVIIFCRIFYAFLVMRFLLGAATTTLLTTSLVLVIEVMSPDLRSIYGIAVLVGQATGNLVMSCVFALRINWHVLQFVGMIPALMMVQAFYKITESPRWLIAKGRTDVAEGIIMHAARMNGENVLEVKKLWTRIKRAIDREPLTNVGKGSFNDFLGLRESLKHTVILCYCWGIISFAYFTISIEIRGTSVLTEAMTLAMSILEVAVQLCAIVGVARIGRRGAQAANLCGAGASCFIASALSAQTTVGGGAMTVVASGFLSAAHCIIWLYTAEIYPTIIRNTGLALCCAFSRFGSSLAPFTNYVSQADSWLQTLVLSCLCGCGAIVTLQLPETSDTSLRDTIHEPEADPESSAATSVFGRPLS